MKPIRVCIAASAGGHLTQLLKLAASWNGRDVFCVTTSEVAVPTLSRYGRVHVIGECNHRHFLKATGVLFQCIRIALEERPEVVISTGHAPGTLMCIVSKVLGARIVWVDSITNVNRMSFSGRLVRHVADLFFAQWPHFAKQYRNVEYLGAVV